MSVVGDDDFGPTDPQRPDSDSVLIVELHALLTREAAQALTTLAAQQRRTANETLQNAIALAFYIDEEVSQGGGVMVRRSDGKLYELIFPWATQAFQRRAVEGEFALKPISPPRSRFMRWFRRA
jgi:hypothetical protein